MRKALLAGQLQRMVYRIGGPVYAIGVRQARIEPPLRDGCRTRDWLIDVGKDVQVRAVAADIGGRDHGVEPERTLQVEVPLLQVGIGISARGRLRGQASGGNAWIPERRFSAYPVLPSSEINEYAEASAKPVTVSYSFYSYSHKDDKAGERLAVHLALLKRSGLIADWSDRQIDVGQDWRAQITHQLESADLILLLDSENSSPRTPMQDPTRPKALDRPDRFPLWGPQEVQSRVPPRFMRRHGA